jgi:hypothetical protein
MPLKSPSELIQCTNITSCFQALYNFLFAIFIALAFLYFLYGAFQYLLSAGGVYPKEEGKSKMKNSLIAMVVALAIPIILNMINPYIFNVVLQVPKVDVVLPKSEYSFGVPGGLPGTYIPAESYGCKISGTPKCELPSTGYCSASNLNNNGNFDLSGQNNVNKMSLICINESHGIPNAISESDKCLDGSPFSFGLFQINMAVHDFELSDGTKCYPNSIFEFTEGSRLKKLENGRYKMKNYTKNVARHYKMRILI